MKFSELPIEVQKDLKNQQAALAKKRINNSYKILLYNESGTRYFWARRHQAHWHDSKGNYLPFGGGSSWSVRYGRVQFRRYKSPLGTDEVELVKGNSFGRSLNGTVIPKEVKTKAEVLAIAKQIGIFNL